MCDYGCGVYKEDILVDYEYLTAEEFIKKYKEDEENEN